MNMKTSQESAVVSLGERISTGNEQADYILQGGFPANSINIGRLAPQVMYYFKAYADLLKAGRIALGDKVHFVVPTGNFGDILAGSEPGLAGVGA